MRSNRKERNEKKKICKTRNRVKKKKQLTSGNQSRISIEITIQNPMRTNNYEMNSQYGDIDKEEFHWKCIEQDIEIGMNLNKTDDTVCEDPLMAVSLHNK